MIPRWGKFQALANARKTGPRSAAAHLGRLLM